MPEPGCRPPFLPFFFDFLGGIVQRSSAVASLEELHPGVVSCGRLMESLSEDWYWQTFQVPQPQQLEELESSWPVRSLILTFLFSFLDLLVDISSESSTCVTTSGVSEMGRGSLVSGSSRATVPLSGSAARGLDISYCPGGGQSFR